MFVLDFIAMHWMMILSVCVAVLVLFLIIFRSSLIRLEILQRIGAIGPYVTVSALIATALWAGDRWQTDATLKYIDKFIDREYAESLWSLQEFTLCFEKKNNHHISYVPYGNILNADADTRRKSLDLAREWWSLVENRQESPKVACGKPKDLEMKLMVVYGRLDALASCAERGLCSWARVEDMLETVDVAVLSIANYIRLTRERSLLKGDRITREWMSFGAFPILAARLEKYVYEGKNPGREPILNERQIEDIRAKYTACEKPDGASGQKAAWKTCMDETSQSP